MVKPWCSEQARGKGHCLKVPTEAHCGKCRIPALMMFKGSVGRRGVVSLVLWEIGARKKTESKRREREREKKKRETETTTTSKRERQKSERANERKRENKKERKTERETESD